MIEIQFCYLKSIEFNVAREVRAIDFCYSNWFSFDVPVNKFVADAPNGAMVMYLSNDKLKLYTDAYPMDVLDGYPLGAIDILPLTSGNAGG